MKRVLTILFILPFLVCAQQSNFRSKSELGFMIGGSYYIGDLNQYKHFYNTQLAGGLVYRYNVHSRLSIRGNFNYGKVKASDADSKLNIMQNRNLNFESKIFELAGGVEFNYFPFRIGNDRYKGTAYVLAEIGLFHMNPTTDFNGDVTELQPLGTEGQGSSLSNKKNYNLTQISIPLGVGCKFSLGKKAALTLEYGYRKTFTDYLDDVGSDSYVDPVLLAAENGPISASLSNRSLDGARFGKRGTSNNSDWYAFFGAMFTFRLGKPSICYNH